MTEEIAITAYIQKEIIRNNGNTLQAAENLIETGIIDSLGIVKLVAYLERTFGIKVADAELLAMNFETVETIASFVRTKQQRESREKKGGYHVHQNV